MTPTIHRQRQDLDCGVAALAHYLNMRYEDVYAVTCAAVPRWGKTGLTGTEIMRVSSALGRPLRRRRLRVGDLDDASGVLMVVWNDDRHASYGHWVALRSGVLIDPSTAGTMDVDEFFLTHAGRPGVLYTEVPE